MLNLIRRVKRYMERRIYKHPYARLYFLGVFPVHGQMYTPGWRNLKWWEVWFCRVKGMDSIR